MRGDLKAILEQMKEIVNDEINSPEIDSVLQKLAEMGQINAIQSWYLLAKDNDDNE